MPDGGLITLAVDDDTVHAALELAGRAPSVHDTQPWRWEFGNAAVHLYADMDRSLLATDPDEPGLRAVIELRPDADGIGRTLAAVRPSVTPLPAPGVAPDFWRS